MGTSGRGGQKKASKGGGPPLTQQSRESEKYNKERTRRRGKQEKKTENQRWRKEGSSMWGKDLPLSKTPANFGDKGGKTTTIKDGGVRPTNKEENK